MKKILTAGIYFLDTIVVRDYPEGPQKQRTFNETIALEEVGGTCGNVATILSWLGQDVYPIAHFDDSAEGQKLSADLARYGCNCCFVRNDHDGGTSTLRCTHKLNPDGSHKVTFRAGSPGSRFPKHRFLRARDEAPAFLEQLDFNPDVFFFDDPAAGHRVLAKALRAKGTLIYFEPARVESNAELESIAASDIIKFSGENIPDTSFIEQFDNKLFIQTMGADGIRFKLGKSDWVKLSPVLNDNYVDYEGAGDWTTSAFINYLCKKGVLSVAQMDVQLVREALEEAQIYASKSVSYLGSKGMIHDKDVRRNNSKYSMQKFYHGTQKMFDRFDLSHAKEGTGLKFGFGVYVTEKYESAAHYCLVRGETVDNDRPYYVYTLEVPDQTEDNYLFSCRPVNPDVVARAEKKLGEAIPQEVSALGKTFRKYIGNKITGKEGSVKKLCGSADFEAEKAAAEFLLGIGVVMLVWPQSQANPDGLQNRAILDGALVKVRKIERIKLDEKAQLISGSEQVVKEF